MIIEGVLKIRARKHSCAVVEKGGHPASIIGRNNHIKKSIPVDVVERQIGRAVRSRIGGGCAKGSVPGSR